MLLHGHFACIGFCGTFPSTHGFNCVLFEICFLFYVIIYSIQFSNQQTCLLFREPFQTKTHAITACWNPTPRPLGNHNILLSNSQDWHWYWIFNCKRPNQKPNEKEAPLIFSCNSFDWHVAPRRSNANQPLAFRASSTPPCKTSRCGGTAAPPDRRHGGPAF